MNTTSLKRLGILTGGGDCPGLNAALRAVAKTALAHGVVPVGIEDGFEGLVDGRMRTLDETDLSGIIAFGGTVLGTSNKGDPFHFPVETAPGHIEIRDVSARVLEQLSTHRIDALVAIGGDGTMHIARRLGTLGVRVVGVPKTIDNDLAATDQTFGYDSAVTVVCEAIDRLNTTAAAHHRVMVVEVMGRYAGWIALGGGVAGGADVILMPEFAWDWPALLDKVNARSASGKRYSIVCVAEGAKLPGSADAVVQEIDPKRTDARRLGGVGTVIAHEIERRTGHETRVTTLGHLQRGGAPTAYDRLLATSLGGFAARCALEGRFGVMAALRGTAVVAVPIDEAVASLRTVPPDHPLVRAARDLGTCFGDAPATPQCNAAPSV